VKVYLALIVYSKDSFSDDLGALFVEGIEIHGSNSRSNWMLGKMDLCIDIDT
jgi:hypothetical protein